MAKTFGSATAFKASLDAHLRKRAGERNVPLNTLQLKFAIERLLARLFHVPAAPWLLKGGFALDLRFRPRARTTKDIDLTIPLTFLEFLEPNGDFAGSLRDRLQEAAAIDLGDYLSYRIGEPKAELTNAPAGGARYPCEAVLLGKIFQTFHLDAGCGDAVVGEPERLTGDDVLAFAGVEPASVLVISQPQQFAEKVHAYSFPWQGRLNTRTKDLVDMVLLIERGPPAPDEIRAALDATFSTRGTHSLPERLSPPPEAWAEDFPGLAREAGLADTDSLLAFAKLDAFWSTHALGGRGGTEGSA